MLPKQGDLELIWLSSRTIRRKQQAGFEQHCYKKFITGCLLQAQMNWFISEIKFLKTYSNPHTRGECQTLPQHLCRSSYSTTRACLLGLFAGILKCVFVCMACVWVCVWCEFPCTVMITLVLTSFALAEVGISFRISFGVVLLYLEM